MEKFIVTGSDSEKIKFVLEIPKAKHFQVQAVFKGEKQLQVQQIINDAVKSKHKTFSFSTYNHTKPNDLPKSMQQILVQHPLPLSQGPVLLPLDTDTEDKLTICDVLRMKTCFSHHSSQKCSDWLPNSIGGSGWGEACYEVRELQYSIEGPASTRYMGLVYTCTDHTCVIHCPCTICTDPNAECKLQCRTEACPKCTSQCPEHKIKLPRLFNSEFDHYTMLTMKMGMFQFATPYAGIPLDCLKCTEDVLDHQIFHLVFHTRCRFCRYELRHFEQRSIVSERDYRRVDHYLQGQENRTCSFCLKRFYGITERRKHEENVHQEKDKEFKCDLCEKTYCNSNALSYHKTTKHEEILAKFKCDLCDLQFSTKWTLLRHSRSIHSESKESDQAKYDCPDCGVTFSRKDVLIRHKREKHFGVKANLDYVEDLDSLTRINCDSCSSKFKRKSDLKRHQETAHGQGEIKMFKCLLCEKMYTRKSDLNRHSKSFHK